MTVGSVPRTGGVARVLALLAAVAGCGDFSEPADAGVVAGPFCSTDVPLREAWPIETATPAGSIEIGVDRGGFAPLPDELTFIMGIQTVPGVLLYLQARMVGLEAGNPEQLLDPRNPRTRFSATFADGTTFGRECPSGVGYAPSEDGVAFELQTPAVLEFEPLAKAEPGFDTIVKIKVEVIDAEGRYASDEREVFCRAPPGWNADAGPADAGPAADGGAMDAAAETDAAM